MPDPLKNQDRCHGQKPDPKTNRDHKQGKEPGLDHATAWPKAGSKSKFGSLPGSRKPDIVPNLGINPIQEIEISISAKGKNRIRTKICMTTGSKSGSLLEPGA